MKFQCVIPHWLQYISQSTCRIPVRTWLTYALIHHFYAMLQILSAAGNIVSEKWLSFT